MSATPGFVSQPPPTDTTIAELDQFFARQGTPQSCAGAAGLLLCLIDAGLDRLPLPGHGATLLRWQMLARVAAYDLSLLKLYEGHTDALAILAEIDSSLIIPNGSMWGVWCAEPPAARLQLTAAGDGRVRLNGRKAWCSGAIAVSHALVSCWNSDGQPCLAAVELVQPGVTVTGDGWHALGMAGSGSVDVEFVDAVALQVGAPGAYLARPGFWHGGAGIAACWYGAACAIGQYLHAQLHAQGERGDPHRLAQLGSIDVKLAATGALLRDIAATIDADPRQDAMAAALRARLAVEECASQVLQLATRALGAGPLCRDARFARLAADLPVFLRQSHAERDLAALGQLVATPEQPSWSL